MYQKINLRKVYMKLIKFSLMLSISLLPLCMKGMDEKKLIKSNGPENAKAGVYAVLAHFDDFNRYEANGKYSNQVKEYARKLNSAPSGFDYQEFETIIRNKWFDCVAEIYEASTDNVKNVIYLNDKK